MSERDRLPLKVVPPLERDFYEPEPSGGPKKIFGSVDAEFRERLVAQVMQVRENFKASFLEFPDVPAVARVTVREDAIAKSHRPTSILTTQTCPIIGAEGLGQLLVSATPDGLENLARRIEKDRTKVGIANMSTLQSIAPYVPFIEPTEDRVAKVKLFRHHSSRFDHAIDESFRAVLKKLRVSKVKEIRYCQGLKIYRLEGLEFGLLNSLSLYVGTQSVGPFPLYQPVRSTAIPIRAAVPQDFPPPEKQVDYPIIGIVDSGTSEADAYLTPWRYAREVYVPAADQDNRHGSFVAGLIVHARQLNHADPGFPSCSSRFVDVVALSKTGTSEDKLLAALEDVIPKYPEVKVWNLSLGTNVRVNNRSFSDLAAALDRLQREHGIIFVIAAGNYSTKPFRGWPPDDLGEADRICAPADSLRSVVVGSIAHRDHAAARVKASCPSPFSRRGPGPLYVPKPELSHFGGNCDAAGACSQIGVLSIDGKGNLAEDLGTSFATPLVTTLLANVSHRLADSPSTLLSRALLVHSAALQNRRIDPSLLKYTGFGTPPEVEVVLACDPWQCTLTFDLEIAPSVAYQKAVFPMPQCLYVNHSTVRANILMTVVHDPDMDASFGSEYCRSNVEVSLGTYDVGSDGKHHQKKQVPEDPNLKGKAYERDLVEYGFKWSPVKVYRREMVRGVRCQNWRLDLSVHHRSGHTPRSPSRVALVITVADPLKQAPVYSEMVATMNSLGWTAADLQVKPRLRV